MPKCLNNLPMLPIMHAQTIIMVAKGLENTCRGSNYYASLNRLSLQHCNPQKRVKTNIGDVSKIRDRANQIYRDITENIVAAYQTYEAYYDQKAKGQPLKVNESVFLFDPEYDPPCTPSRIVHESLKLSIGKHHSM